MRTGFRMDMSQCLPNESRVWIAEVAAFLASIDHANRDSASQNDKILWKRSHGTVP